MTHYTSYQSEPMILHKPVALENAFLHLGSTTFADCEYAPKLIEYKSLMGPSKEHLMFINYGLY